MNNFLRYGDAVAFYYSNQEKGSQKKGSTMHGLLTSPGYIDNYLYFQPVFSQKEGGFKFSKDDEAFSSLREGIFKLTPRLMWECHQEHYRLSEQFNQMIGQLEKQGQNEQTIVVAKQKEDLLARLKKSEDRMNKETLTNLALIQESEGRVVSYGSEVQLLHLESNTFLSVEAGHENLLHSELKLSGTISSHMLFKPIPRYKSRREGDPIQIEDIVIWAVSDGKSFISVAELDEEPDPESTSTIHKHLPDLRGLDSSVNRRRVCISSQSDWAFQVQLYTKYESRAESDTILGGDLIRIIHSETGAELTADVCYEDQKYPTVYFRLYRGDTLEEVQSCCSLWFAEHTTRSGAGEPFMSQAADDNSIASMSIRLRHLVTNQLIITDCPEEAVEKELKIAMPFHDSQKPTNFAFESVVPGQIHMSSNQAVFFMTQNNIRHLRMKKDKLLKREVNLKSKDVTTNPEYKGGQESLKSNNEGFAPLGESDLSETRYFSMLLPEFDQSDAFRPVRVDPEEKEACLFLRSAISLLRKHRKAIRNPHTYTFTSQDTIEAVLDILNQVTYYICGNQGYVMFQGSQAEMTPIPVRQKLFREMGVLTSIAEIVMGIQAIPVNFKGLFAASYRAIKLGVEEYRPNELFLSQWMSSIAIQAIKYQSDEDLGAEKAFAELLDNNKRILETRLEPDILQMVVEELVKRMDPKLILILRAVVICEGMPLARTQKLVTDFILKEEEVRSKLLYKITSDNYDEAMLSFPGVNIGPLPIKDFHSKSTELDGGKSFEFVVLFTNLLADLCAGRNQAAIESLQSSFSLEILTVCITSNSLPLKLRAALSTLASSLWIDISPFQHLELPLKIRIWEDLPTGMIFTEPSPDLSRDKLKKFILNHIGTLYLGKGERSTEDVEDVWAFDLSMLSLALTMLWLGFFCDTKSISKLMTYILKFFKQQKFISIHIRSFSMTKSKSSLKIGGTIQTSYRHKTGVKEAAVTKTEDAPKLVTESRKKALLILDFGLRCSEELHLQDFMKRSRSSLENLDHTTAVDLEIAWKSLKTLKYIKLEEIKTSKSSKLYSIFENLHELASSSATPHHLLSLSKDSELLSVLASQIKSSDEELRRVATELLLRLFSQIRILGKAIREVKVIDDPSSLAHFRQTQEYQLMLSETASNAERWFWDSSSQEMARLGAILNVLYRSLLSHQSKSPNHLQTQINLIGFSSPNKSQFEPSGFSDERLHRKRNTFISPTYLDLKNSSRLTDLHQYLLDSEREDIDPFEQELFRLGKIYNGLLRILEFDISHLNQKRIEPSKHLLRKIYRLLAKSCYLAPHNKAILSPYIESHFLVHLNELVDLNCYFLLYNLASENFSLQTDFKRVDLFVETLCSNLAPLMPHDPRKAYYLRIIGELVVYKGQPLDYSQRTILRRIISNDLINFKDTLLLQQEQDSPEENIVQKSTPEYLYKCVNDIGGRQVIVVPADLCFTAALLEVLAVCTQKNNVLAETICQSYLGLERLKNLLSDPLISLTLKKPLVVFLYYVHLSPKKDLPLHAVEVFLDVIQAVVEDYEYYHEGKYIEDWPEGFKDGTYFLSESSFKSFSDMIYEYQGLLINCFKIFTWTNLRLIPESEPWVRFDDLYGRMSAYIGNAKSMRNLQEQSMGEASGSLRKLGNDHEPPKLASFENLHLTAPGAKVKRTSKPRSSKLKTNIDARVDLFRHIEALVDIYFTCREYQFICKKEFTQLVIILNQHADKSHSISSQDIDILLSNLARVAKESIRLESSSMSIQVILELMQAYLFASPENIGVAANKPASIASAPQGEPKEADIVISPALLEKQARLCKLGIPELIGVILNEEMDSGLQHQALILSVTLLRGGVKECQKSFIELFKSEDALLILAKMNDKIKHSFEVVRKSLVEHSKGVTSKYKKKRTERQEEEEEEAVHRKIVREEIDSYDLHYSNCFNILKFLIELLSGSSQEMRELLRGAVRREHPNIVATVVDIWGGLAQIINSESTELGNLTLEFLIRCQQGPNAGNQQELFKNNFIEYTNDFFSDTYGLRENQSFSIDHMLTKCVHALRSMLEANPSPLFYSQIGMRVDIGFMLNKLSDKFIDVMDGRSNWPDKPVELVDAQEVNKLLRIQIFDKSQLEAFDIYFFIQAVEEQTGLYANKLKQLNGLDAFSWSFYKFNSAYVEVLFHNSLHKQYFAIHPMCRSLQKSQKKVALLQFQGLSPVLQILNFLRRAPQIFDKIELLTRIQASCSLFSEKTLNITRWFCFLLTLALNLYMFVNLEKTVSHSNSQVVLSDGDVNFFKGLGSVHLVSSLFLLTLWLALRARLICARYWRDCFTEFRIALLKKEPTSSNRIAHQEALLLLQQNALDMSRQTIESILRFRSKLEGTTIRLPLLHYYSQNVLSLIKNPHFDFLLFYVTCSVVALLTGYLHLYSFHLFDLVTLSSTMQLILYSLAANGKQFIQASLLALLVLYFYSVVAFLYFDSSFWNANVGDGGEAMCHTLLQCLTEVMLHAPRSAGSIGDVLLQPSYSNSSDPRMYYYARWIYDLSIFVIFNLFCLRILIGIIIDTFAKLREDQNNIQYNRNNICFICHLDRHVFDKLVDGFENHISRDHNIWNYLYFLYSLKHKPQKNFSGIEQFVAQKLLTEDAQWVPIGRSISLSKIEESQNVLEGQMRSINHELESLFDLLAT